MKTPTLNSTLKLIKSHASPDGVKGMARFGIVAKKAYGLSAPILKSIAKEIGKNHDLALELWATEIYDARILAVLIDEPKKIPEAQLESWVNDFDSWAICDSACMHLFDKTPFAWKKAIGWSKRNEEYVKRAGYTMMASLAIHDKKAPDAELENFFPHLLRGATDERNFVKKAVNWALRQIGKRNLALNAKAIELSLEIQKLDSSSARWIAADALRELRSEAVQERLKKKAGRNSVKTI